MARPLTAATVVVPERVAAGSPVPALERERDVRRVGRLVAVLVEDRDLDRAERGAGVRARGLLRVGEMVGGCGADREGGAVRGGECPVGGGELVTGGGPVDREAAERGHAGDGGDRGGAGEGGGGVAAAGLDREGDARRVTGRIAELVEDRDLDRAERGACVRARGLLGVGEVVGGGRADREGVAVGGGEGAVGGVQLVAGCGLVDREAAEGGEAVRRRRRWWCRRGWRRGRRCRT